MSDTAPTNAPEFSVSELSSAIKRTMEESFERVRVRGEISGYRGPHSSGHSYFALKDQNSKIDAIIWKGVFSRLKFKPEEGMEVIATGKITTFPGKSSYQIVIDQIEPAGVGALLAQLEERKRRLSAEGLFAPERKQLIPYLPEVIGVITSPTGAVIRDIIHRISDRFPRHILIWPVRVQGETCASEVANAIEGFNSVEPNTDIARPDVLIVARGGGSLEDLWGFNEEIVARAASMSEIPLVSAVGHETDTTLIDFVSDLRAPTPTGAAEFVVPVRSELLLTLSDLASRLNNAALRLHQRRVIELRSVIRALPMAESLLNIPRQRLDLCAVKLPTALRAGVDRRRIALSNEARKLYSQSPQMQLVRYRERLSGGIATRLQSMAQQLVDRKKNQLNSLWALLPTSLQKGINKRRAMLNAHALRLNNKSPQTQLVLYRERLNGFETRLPPVAKQLIERRKLQISTLWKILNTLGHKQVLARGYAIIRDEEGQALRSATKISNGMRLNISLNDGDVKAIVGEGQTPYLTNKPTLNPKPGQGNLF
jgi:exodeoxyribonuclease VII large subunit